MTLKEQLKEIENLTVSEKTLINYMLNNTDAFLKQNPETIAKEAFVSVSTIYRLVEKLDLSGIVALKLQLAQESGSSDAASVDVNYPFDDEQIIVSLSNLYTQTQKGTITNLNLGQLQKIALMIFNAHKATVYTASSNIYFAQNFQFQLQEIGLDIQVPLEDYMQRLHAANSTKRDFAIVISYGGRSRTTQEVMRILKENNTPILLITSVQDNPLSKDADFMVSMYSDENHFDKVSSFSSRLSLLFILDSIYSSVFHIDPQTHLDYKKRNYQKMNRDLV